MMNRATFIKLIFPALIPFELRPKRIVEDFDDIRAACEDGRAVLRFYRDGLLCREIVEDADPNEVYSPAKIEKGYEVTPLGERFRVSYRWHVVIYRAPISYEGTERIYHWDKVEPPVVTLELEYL